MDLRVGRLSRDIIGLDWCSRGPALLAVLLENGCVFLLRNASDPSNFIKVTRGRNIIILS